MAKPGSVVSKTLTRFRVATLGRGTGCFLHEKKRCGLIYTWVSFRESLHMRLTAECALPKGKQSVIGFMMQVGTSGGPCCSESQKL